MRPALVSEGTALRHDLNVLSEAVEKASPLAPSPRASGPLGAVEQALLPYLESHQILDQAIVPTPAQRPGTFAGAGVEVGGALRWPVRPEMGIAAAELLDPAGQILPPGRLHSLGELPPAHQAQRSGLLVSRQV